MRFLVVFLPAILFAQTPAPPPATAAKKPAAVAPKAAAASAAKPAAAGAAKPAGTATAPKPVAKPTPKPVAAAPKPMTEEEKTIYALGLFMSRSLQQFDPSPAELELVRKALLDAAAGKPDVKLDEYVGKFGELTAARKDRVAAKQKAAAEAFLTKALAEPGASKTDSGLIYKDLTPGTGPSPTAADTVKVNYKGALTDGTEFDSSYKRGEPAQFPLANVIKCWTEGVQKMKVGGKAQLVCPAAIAYGEAGHPPTIPGGATLVFEVELLEIVK